MLRHGLFLLTALLLPAAAGAPTPAWAQAVSLPGGAASLRETHGDWTVACALQSQDGKTSKLCALAQEQFAQNPRQRVLAIELQPNAGAVKGTLLLPFGLALEKGVSFQLDEAPPGAAQRFRTCLPAGCLVPVEFDAKILAALRTGKVLKVKAVADGGPDMLLSISLNGFASAFDRTASLLK